MGAHVGSLDGKPRKSFFHPSGDHMRLFFFFKYTDGAFMPAVYIVSSTHNLITRRDPVHVSLTQVKEEAQQVETVGNENEVLVPLHQSQQWW